MTPEEKLAYNAQLGREQHQLKQSRQQQIRDRQIPSLQVQSWDTAHQAYRATAPDGTVRYVEPLTNGAIAAGDAVRSGRNRIDAMPHKPKAATPSEVIKKVVAFWNLNEDYLYEISVKGNKAIAKLLAKASDFPSPYDRFHGAEPGLARISATEFYLPKYSRIDRYNFATTTAETVAVSGFSYTYSSCSLPDKTAFFAVESDSIANVGYVIRINPDGSVDTSPQYSRSEGDNWSIAAIDRDNLIFVTDYGYCSRFSFTTGDLTHLFQNLNTTVITSLYGNEIDGRKILEVTYAYADPATKACYVFGTVENEESLPDYTVTNAQVVGDAPESSYLGDPLKIISGSLPAHAIPGDDTGALQIHKIVDNNTFYAYGDFGIYWEGSQDLGFNLRRRRFRSVIWRVLLDNTVTTHFIYPGIDNRETATGYRYHYNFPCRGGIFDPRTKSIYAVGFRDIVVEGGKFQGRLAKPSQKPLIRIKNGQMQAIAITPGQGAPTDFETSFNWYSQFEPIY